MYKSGKQRSFLFALDKDKVKGIDPTTVQHPPASPLASPLLNTSPTSQPGIHQAIIKMPTTPPIMSSTPVNQTAIPSMPSLTKLPKFGKIKNSLKGQFRGIK